jgi:hypothetical protein
VLKLNLGVAAALLAFNVGSGKSLALEPTRRPESQNGVRGQSVFDRRWRGNKVLRSSIMVYGAQQFLEQPFGRELPFPCPISTSLRQGWRYPMMTNTRLISLPLNMD